MSARLSPIERAARRIASDALQGARRRRKSDQTAWQVFEEATQVCERLTSYAVVSDDIPRARRTARAGQLLDESQARMVARSRRDRARKLARAGIVPNARVVVVRTGYGANAAPTGTVMTLEDVTETYYLWGTDDDGHRWLVNYRDLEVVPDAPIPHSRIQVGDDVLTPGRGAGVVEHVDIADGVTVRVADGETLRYEPEQLTRGVLAAVGDGLIVLGLSGQATVLDVHDDGYSFRYDGSPDALRCLYAHVVKVLPQAVTA